MKRGLGEASHRVFGQIPAASLKKGDRFTATAAALAPFGVVNQAQVETNIVLVDLGGTGWSAEDFVLAGFSQGVHFHAISAPSPTVTSRSSATGSPST